MHGKAYDMGSIQCMVRLMTWGVYYYIGLTRWY